MSPSIKQSRPPMSGIPEDALLQELKTASWDKPFQKAIEELRTAYGSHLGSKRGRNEDRLLVTQFVAANKERYSVAVVCDGVGGSEMGDAAATCAVWSFVSELRALRQRTAITTLLPEIVRKVDATVRNRLNGRGATTLCAIVASSNGPLAATSIGDSRLFSWAPKKGHFRQVSVDDTLANELKNLSIKDSTVLHVHGLQESLSQAIGDTGRSPSDLKIPVYTRQDFQQGAVLATDGMWKGCEPALSAVFLEAPTGFDAIKRSTAFAIWAGGADNASIIAIDDLAAFFPRFPKETAQACNVAWVGDTKIILPEVPLVALEEPKAEFSTKRIPEKKGKPGKSSPKEKTKGNLLLNLIPENKESGRRAKIEISTDDSSPSSL
jgi:serine/threonine protein phosphatase PrpC